MKNKIIQNIKSIVLALILTLGISYVSAYSTWVAPTATAPGNNTDMPLNVGNTGQVKIGGLTLNTGGATNGLIVQSGNVGIGTASPLQKLQIGDNSVASLGYRIAAAGVNWDQTTDSSGNLNIANGGGTYLTFNKTTNASYFNYGNVGIGTQTPSSKLDVNGVINGTAVLNPTYAE